MEIKAYATRQNGQWKIRIYTPEWVINDILHDGELQTNAVITIDCSEPYYGRIPASLLASVRFEEAISKKEVEFPIAEKADDR